MSKRKPNPCSYPLAFPAVILLGRTLTVRIENPMLFSPLIEQYPYCTSTFALFPNMA